MDALLAATIEYTRERKQQDNGSNKMAHTGQCLCGAIKYEFLSDPAAAVVCHCKNCQRKSGSAFATIAGVPKADFQMTGKPKLYLDNDTDSGNTVERYFCGNCGSPIYSAVPAQDPDNIYLNTGTMEDTGGFSPAYHVWTSTKQDWVALSEDVPQITKQTNEV